ncbi:hypothetical protein D3C86_2230710 [compost metagenome]
MEFLTGSAALPPLEILNGIGAVRDRLQRRELMHTRTLQLAYRLPVRQAWRALHQQERLSTLQGPE